MPEQMIPVYVDYVKTRTTSSENGSTATSSEKSISAIIMELLAGEDMHHLRHRHSHTHRRLAISDAVYLCKDVILPLLREMHLCGVIHRDVKPSNCVRTGTTPTDRNFKVVDFGLSKSFIVPEGDKTADKKHPWKPKSAGGGPVRHYFRKERPDAEFRGTSMYASLRVHQLRDYARRDDIWGLMYVFCDLVSGGLPWMEYAATRKRDECQKMKEWIQGESSSLSANKEEKENGSSEESPPARRLHIEELLKGAEYHKSNHRLQKAKHDLASRPPSEHKLPPLAEPLAMSKDVNKIQALTNAFVHLAALDYTDSPDYDLIEQALNQFQQPPSSPNSAYYGKSGNSVVDNDIPCINWQQPTPDEVNKRRWERKMGKVKEEDTISSYENVISLVFDDDDAIECNDPLKEDTLNDAENENELLEKSNKLRLPLNLQLRLAQVEYNSLNHKTIPPHLALRDWMELAVVLAYIPWDSKKYERAGNRKKGTLYQRESYVRILEQCLKGGEAFNMFQSRDCFYFTAANGSGEGDGSGLKSRKRRKISVVIKNDSISHPTKVRGDMMELSKVICMLRKNLDLEQNRTLAPPPAISW